jgi:uncharacterized protein (UPF0332 family)
VKVKPTRRVKERSVAYATRPRRKTRALDEVPFPQARHLTRQERVALAAYRDFLLEKFPNEIARVVLFGSKARGDAAPDADLDLLIVVSGADPSFLPGGSRWSELGAGAYKVGLEYGVYISTIVRQLDQVQKWTPLLDNVRKEGIELWRRPGTERTSWLQGGQAGMASSKQEHIEARMAVAKDKLRAARKLIEESLYNDAISRAYYAMFYASKVLLLALGEDPHKHEGVVSLYGERVVRLGLSDSHYGTILRKAKQLREDADYEDLFRATKEQVEDAIRNAEDFVNQAEKVLRKIQA